MQYVIMAVVGLVVGVIAKFIYGHIMPGVHIGWIMTAVLGIAGSYLAGFVGGLIHKPSDGSAFNPAGFIYSVIGALVLIFVAHNVLHLV